MTQGAWARGQRRRNALAGVLLALASCAMPRPVQVPMRQVEHPLAAGRRSDTAVILLPGHGDRPEQFTKHGFVAALREAGVDADVIVADAHSGYYFKGIAAERLWGDVIAPAKLAGYARIWLVGISMGGFGALWTAQTHPEAITGIVVMAPFAGRPRVLRPIAEVGVKAWQPTAEKGTWDYELWRWLKSAPEPGTTVPPIWLAYGDDDAGTGVELLRQIVPKERVFTRPGDHDWDVWAPLWRTMIPVIPWTGAPAPATSVTPATPETGEGQ